MPVRFLSYLVVVTLPAHNPVDKKLLSTHR
jgi:hypothetical protein